MQAKNKISQYHNSVTKRLSDLTFASTILIISLPLSVVVSTLIVLQDGGSPIFVQKRKGKNNNTFRLLKFRTMIVGAEAQKRFLEHLNEAKGPVFKIKNDPRYTKFGKILANTGLDELPQLFNVLKGEMSLVGPRPLPLYEANKLSKKEKVRNSIKPGITSSWVVEGAHKLKFKDWMELDQKYVENGSFREDLRILYLTSKMVINQIIKILA